MLSIMGPERDGESDSSSARRGAETDSGGFWQGGVWRYAWIPRAAFSPLTAICLTALVLGLFVVLVLVLT